MQRIMSLDVMRGLSICGILFMNILGFHYLNVYYEPFIYYDGRISRWLYKLNEIFVFNSFYPIFAFLFGIGLAIMFRNTQTRNENTLWILYRRIIAMLVFGVLHGYLLFYGDIMNAYAVMALFVIPLLYLPNIISIIVASILGILGLLTYAATYFMTDSGGDFISGANESVLYQAIQNGNIREIIHQNMMEFNASNALTFIGIISNVITLLPFILLGVILFRSGVLSKITTYKNISIIIATIATLIGLAVKYYGVKGHMTMTQSQIFIYYGGSILSVGYFTFVTLMCEHPILQKIFKPFQNMGKLSFTLYIMQSVIMFIMFYICKAYDRIPIDFLYCLAGLIIIVQLLFSHFYLKRFKMGPLEFIWRKITYLK